MSGKLARKDDIFSRNKSKTLNKIDPEKFQGLQMVWVMDKRNFHKGVQKKDEELIHK